MLASVGVLFRGLCGLVMLVGVVGCEPEASDSATQRVRIGNQVFDLELALDPETRFAGLSDRADIPTDGGMLFVFPEPGIQVFVMRRCLVPIDILFLGPSGRIVAMHEMRVEPYDTPERQLQRYSSRWPAQFAIELKGGSIGAIAPEPGEKIDLPLGQLMQRVR